MVDIAKPWTKVIKKDTTFKATAGANAATQIGKNGLKAVDTTALQGQDLTEEFWHKGVALADNTPAEKKAEFAALLKEATVTDITNPARTTAKAGEKVGTLLVTFKDGSTIEVEKQKLIVKANTVTVAFDKAKGKEHTLRDGDTTVKGKISASSNSKEFPVSLDGALVTIKKGDTVLSRTLANADGSFVAGVKDKLNAGEDISVVVTLPESKTESKPVTEKVQLNPDKLNEIIPTGEQVVKNLKGKKGVDQTKVATLEKAIKKAYDELVEKAGENQKQEDQKVKSTVKVNADGQKSLDNQYEAIKKAIEELTSNNIPEIKGEAYKEIFKGDALDLNKVVVDVQKEAGKDYTGYVELVDDDNVKSDATKNIQEKIDLKHFNGKYYQLKVEKQKIDENTKAITWENVAEDEIANINQIPGTYKVTYSVEDNFGAKATHTMTLVVKKDVIEVPGEFPNPTPEGYVKVEFISGEHAGLKGASKYLVKKGSAGTAVTVPTIVPEEGWKIDTPAWTNIVPETFANDFETTAKVLEKVKTTEPQEDEKDKYATVEFKEDDDAHKNAPRGTFEKQGEKEQTAKFWVLKNEPVTFNAPTVTAKENYKFTDWDKKVQSSYDEDTTHTATYKAKVVTEDPQDTTNYAKLTFDKGDHGKFEASAKTEIWVLKNEEVKFNAPTPTADKNFTFAKWDPELQTKYDADKKHTAKYTSDKNVSDTPVEGFQEVKFTTDVKDGKFVNEKKDNEKSVWVRPNTLVDLTDKQPTVTVINDKKAYKGWSQKLIAEFAKSDQATEIKALYKDKVVTNNPNDTDYAEIKFDAGKHGTFEKKDEKTTFWVLKGEDVTADFKAPTVTAKAGYTFNKWSPEVQTSYDKNQTHTATYKTSNSISDTPVEGFQEVKFLAGNDGKLENNETSKSVWVEPGVLVDLRDKAPKVIANEGKVHTGWSQKLVAKFTKSDKPTEITAQYKDKVVTDDPQDKKNYAMVEFLADDDAHKTDPRGTFEQVGDPKKNQTTKYWVLKGEEVTFNAPTVTPKSGYSFTGWKEPIKTVYSEDTTHKAQYSNSISDKYVEGWTEITFNSGDHGRFVADAKTVKWVDPKADVKLSDMAPGITPDTNYSFDGWKDGQNKADLDTAQKFEKAKTFTASYVSDISDNEDTTKVKVTFKPGKNGKFKGTAQEKSVWIKANKDIDLRDKAPTVIPNQGYGHDGWKNGENPIDITKVNVSRDTEITASYAAGSFDKDNIVKLIVLGPEKASYKEGEPLDLTGLKVEAIDNQGIRQTYTYKNGKLLENNDPANELVATLKISDENIKFKNENNLLKVDTKLERSKHNGKPITVEYNNVGYDTIVKLTVLENQTETPTEVVAANQGSDTTTKVRFKAVQPADIKIYKAGDTSKTNLIKGTPVQGTGDDAGYLIATLNTKLNEGTWIEITAKEANKLESVPEQAKVIRDKNSKWEADTGSKLSTPVIDPIREKDEKVVVEAPKAEDKIQTIEVSDQNRNTVKLTKDATDATGKTWKVDGSNDTVKENSDGKIVIPVKDKLPLNDRDQIKVTFKDGETPANEAFDRAPVQKASQTPTVDPVYTGEKEVKIVDPTIADPTAKTLKVKVNDNDTRTIKKQDDGTWKDDNNPNAKIEVKDGKVIVDLDPAAKKDDVIKVSTINDSKVESQAAEVKVKDKVLTKKPTIDRANKDENVVEGTAAPGAKVTITVTPKNGQPKTFIGEADASGNYKVTTDKLVDGDKVVAKASEPGKADNTSDPKTVGVKTDELQKSIKKAEKPEIGGNDGANLDEKKPIDKELKDALTKGKEVKKKGDAGDPDTDQDVVDKAKENLDKAIAQKEADTAVDNAKDKVLDPNASDADKDNAINDAQDKIDKIPGTVNDNPIKKDLQDKLDLIKKIKEGEDRLKQDDVTGGKDGKTPKKPQEDIDKLKKAIQDGKDALNKNEKGKFGEKTKEIEKAINILNQDRINVTFEAVSYGSKTLFLRTSVPGARITVSINGKIITKSKARNKEGKLVDVDYVTTDAFGTYTLYFGNINEDGHDFTEGLSENDKIIVKATKDRYNPGEYTEIIY